MYPRQGQISLGRDITIDSKYGVPEPADRRFLLNLVRGERGGGLGPRLQHLAASLGSFEITHEMRLACGALMRRGHARLCDADTPVTQLPHAVPFPLRRRPEGSTQPLCFLQLPAGALRSVPDLAGDAAVQVVYRDLLAQSVFTLCPGNPEWLTEESHCVWEALEARSIPVVLDGVSWDVLG